MCICTTLFRLILLSFRLAAATACAWNLTLYFRSPGCKSRSTTASITGRGKIDGQHLSADLLLRFQVTADGMILLQKPIHLLAILR